MNGTFRAIICSCATCLAVAVLADPATGWKQTGAGPYDYNDADNWVNGEINGIFGSDLTLTAGQTITFSKDTVLPNGLDFEFAGKFKVKLQSADDTVHTLTLQGDFINNAQTEGASVEPQATLAFDLDGATRTFKTSVSGVITVMEGDISNGGLISEGAGVFRLNGNNTYTGGSRFDSTGAVYFNSATAFGTGPVTFRDGIKLACTKAVTISAANPLTFEGDVSYGSAYNSGLGSGAITIKQPLTATIANGYTLSIAGQVAEDSPYDILDITKTGSGSLATSANINIPEGATRVINVNQYNWYWSGAITGGGTLEKKGGGTLQFSKSFAFAGLIDVYAGAVQFSYKLTYPVTFKLFLRDSGLYYAYYNKTSKISNTVSGALSNGLIDAASTGAVGVSSDESGLIDLAAFPYLRLFPNGGDRVVSSVTAPTTGVYRFGGGGKTLKINCALAAGCDIDATKGSLQIAAAQPNFDGTVTMGNGFTFTLGSGIQAPKMTVVGGTYTWADSKTTGGIIRMATAVAGEFDSLKKVVLNTSHLSIDTPTKGDTTLKISDGVEVGALRGGTSRITVPAGVTLQLGGIAQKTGRELLCFNSSGKVLLDQVVQIGSGAAGTVTVPVVPFVRTADNALMTYDDTDGLRTLTDDEYETYEDGYSGLVTTSGANVRISGTVNFTGSATVNSLSMGDNALTGDDGVSLTVNAGAVAVSSAGAANLAIPLDFAAKRGYVSSLANKAATLNGNISGTGGLTIGDTSYSEASSGWVVATTGSTYSGDVLLTTYVKFTKTTGFFPHGEKLSEDVLRLGDIWLYGKIEISSGTCAICSLNGAGTFSPSGSSTSSLTFNNVNTDGNFTGTIGQGSAKLNFGATKDGVRDQRLSGLFAGKWDGTIKGGGRLIIDGTCNMGDRATTYHVYVTNGILAGTGSVSTESSCGTIIVGEKGVIAPGSPYVTGGELNLGKNLEMAQGASFEFAVGDDGTTPAVVAEGYGLTGKATTVPVVVTRTVTKSGSWMLLEADSFGGKELALDKTASTKGGSLSVKQIMADDGETVAREQLWYTYRKGFAVAVR